MVMVDAGHGGRDPGAAGLGGLVEKDVALVVAAGLAAKLAARLPVTAVLTRWDDSFVPLGERLPAPDGPATVFLSLHANASRDASAHGVEIFFGGDLLQASATGDGPSPRAQRLGQTIAHALGATGARIRGTARPGRFAVLRHNPAPGVLVELGYLTNPADAAALQDPARLDAITDALVDGVARFLRAGV
jgi:N-acetylmuramoyl-L-alanine amidase